MKKYLLFLSLLVILSTAACKVALNLDYLPTVPAEMIPSELPPPTQTMPPEPTVINTPTLKPDLTFSASLTPTPFKPFQVTASEEKVNIRTNPGLLFDVQMMVEKDTPLTVIGRAAGSEWLLVENEKHKRGWVAAAFVKSEIPIIQAPLVQPERVFVIQGRVFDQALSPVVGLKFSIAQVNESTNLHNEAVTDETGTFYAFLPVGLKDNWVVSYMVAVCSSPLMDPGCTCKKGSCGLAKPISVTLTLPQKSPLLFSWQ